MKSFDQLFDEMLDENLMVANPTNINIHTMFAYLDSAFGHNIFQITESAYQETLEDYQDYIFSSKRDINTDLCKNNPVFKKPFSNLRLKQVYCWMTSDGFNEHKNPRNDRSPWNYYAHDFQLFKFDIKQYYKYGSERKKKNVL